MNPGEDIRDIKGIVPLYSSLTFWLTILAVLVVFAALYRYFSRRKRNLEKPAEPPPPPRPAHEIALERLERLRALPLTDAASIKRFHFELSETARSYIESRFGVPATDRTIDELETVIAGIPRAGDALSLLKKADLVKFTDFNPGETTSRSLLDDTRAFVVGTSA